MIRRRQIGSRFDALLGDHPRFLAAEGIVVAEESAARRLAHAGGEHLGFEFGKPTHDFWCKNIAVHDHGENLPKACKFQQIPGIDGSSG